MLSYTERLRARRSNVCPDGRYEFIDYLDDDGIDPQPIPIQVAVEVRGSDLEVNFRAAARK